MDGVVSSEDDDGGNIVFSREGERVLSDACELGIEAKKVISCGGEGGFETGGADLFGEALTGLVESLAVDVTGFEVDDGGEEASWVDSEVVSEEVSGRLNDGADSGVFFICGEFATSHHGEEEVIGVRGVHSGGDAVEVLHGCAELDVTFIESAFEVIDALAFKDFEVVAEVIEEGGEEDEESFILEFFGNGDSFSAGWFEGIDELIDEVLAFAEGVRGAIREFFDGGTAIPE